VKYLVDTDICIYVINQRPRKVIERFQQAVVAELAFEVAKTGSQRNRDALQAFLLPLEIVTFDLEAALTYGDVRAELEAKGKPLGPLDTMIAAHARALGLTLVTNNVREFKRVRGLAVENWAT
jgi:tRNA(fMet)-specific endonuclease VapC